MGEGSCALPRPCVASEESSLHFCSSALVLFPRESSLGLSASPSCCRLKQAFSSPSGIARTVPTSAPCSVRASSGPEEGLGGQQRPCGVCSALCPCCCHCHHASPELSRHPAQDGVGGLMWHTRAWPSSRMVWGWTFRAACSMVYNYNPGSQKGGGGSLL